MDSRLAENSIGVNRSSSRCLVWILVVATATLAASRVSTVIGRRTTSPTTALAAPERVVRSWVILVDPTNHLFDGAVEQDGDFSGICRFSRTARIAVHVSFDRTALPLAEGEQRFDLTQATEVHVAICQFGTPGDGCFCGAADGSPDISAMWVAIAGKMQLANRIGTPPPNDPHRNATHCVSIVLEDVIVKHAETSTIARLKRIEIPDVWMTVSSSGCG